MTDAVDPVSSPSSAPGADDAAVARAPLCFVVEDEPSIRHFLSLILHGAGLDTEEFPDGAAMREAAQHRLPDLVFHSIGIESSDAIDSILCLAQRGFTGSVQVMSNRGAAVLEHVKGVGVQNKLNMLPILKKPFETETIVNIVKELKLGTPSLGAGTVSLVEAMDQGWLEFWFQPKIDLRKKQLAGTEAFARVRHPEHGILTPGAFMPGASEADIVKLAELSVTSALKAADKFCKLGVNLRVSVNVPVPALVKLPIEDLVRAHRPSAERWAGLVIDVTEEQIVSDLALAASITKRLDRYNVKLAIDDFGRGYSSLARLKELPFAELKLDRAFVTNCGTDKVNAPLCKTVIDLAHNFGSVAVAIGIEKATDAVALVTMGCDYGQGFLLGQPMAEERFLSLLRQRAGAQGRKLAPGQQPQKQSA
ncbi:MAG TPA: EAL domain-containing response regulator [Pseudolabrys sp.]|nr:EAL domain-containing response regulator [Pseudolabrys sp.]